MLVQPVAAAVVKLQLKNDFIREPALCLCLIGLALLLQQVFVNLIAAQFLFEVDIAKAPILPFVLSQIAAGLALLCLLPLIPRTSPSKKLLLIVLLLGLLLRVLNFGTTPIMEIDFYRYLWDGAMSASGFNPWQLSPQAVSNMATSNLASLELQSLADDGRIVLARINYADLRTIYPPVAQFFFAISFWLEPWSLDAWRALLLVSDLISLFFILKLLTLLKRPALYCTLYWWNPLLIHETYNSLHMDILLIPFILLAIWLMFQQRALLASPFLASPLLASMALVIAAGIKLWPLLLLAFTLRPLLSNRRQLITSCMAILLFTIVIIGPLIIFGNGDSSGLTGYASSWLRNSALFPLLNSFFGNDLITRGIVVLLLTVLVLIMNRKTIHDPNQLIRSLCWVVAALFLLSPTQFPWYTIWFAPLLCFYSQPALILLMSLMPIYYLRFYWSAIGQVDVFDSFIIWLQYLPVYGLLLITLLRHKQTTAKLSVHA